ncbi:MAG: hypothetical protein Q8O89_06275 [Nanoarchaeota archaeon]|nr:hypothetical protein [Nanoarchaeota archaeon]
MEGLEKIISDSLISYQREEIQKRYSNEKIRQLGFSIPDEEVEFMRNIVNEKFYPSIEDRQQFSEYFESLKNFTKPSVLLSAVSVFARLLVKYRKNAGELLSLSKQALNIYKTTKKIDDDMIKYIAANYDVSNNFSLSQEIYEKAYVCVSEERREKVISQIIGLTHCFENKTIMANIRNVLNDFAAELEKKPELLKQQIDAVRYINGFMSGATDFFLKKSEQELKTFTLILERTEREYTSGIYWKIGNLEKVCVYHTN